MPLLFKLTARSLSRVRQANRRMLRCEPLEDRRMLSVLFVDDDAAGGGDGLAWSSAFDDLQAALDRALVLNADGNADNDIDAIWIAEGTYKPSAELESGDARSATFSLLEEVTLYGGFAGTETTLEERPADPLAHETVLSGDLGVEGDIADNAYTVVYCGELVEAAIDGVTVTGGNADGDFDDDHYENTQGGGIYSAGTLVIAHAILSHNAAQSGGGICARAGSVEMTNCLIAENTATTYGGALLGGAAVTVTNSTIVGNSAPKGNAGGFYGSVTLTLNNSVFWDNGTEDIGGEGKIIGANNLLSIDPWFADPDAGDYRLTEFSPALNRGDTSLVDGSRAAEGYPLVDYDLDGNPRIHAGAVDIGAFEYQGEPASGLETPSTTITTPEDVFDRTDGEISLREAIYYAGDVHSPTVTFEASLDGATVTLAGSALIIDKSLTIDATALDTLAVDGDAKTRVLIVQGGEDCHVGLAGLTITGGKEVIGAGLVNHAALTITNSVITGNTADTGAGISNTGALSIVDSVILNNWARYEGGGVYSTGTVNVNDSVISMNTSGFSGGGIENASGTLTVVGSTIARNEVIGFSDPGACIGGGIFNSGSLNLLDSIVFGNEVKGSISYGTNAGGGIASFGNAKITNTVIACNTARGAYLEATNHGAGIYNDGTLRITNATLADNHAQYADGTISNRRGLTLNNTVLWNPKGAELTGDGTVIQENSLIGIDPEFVDAYEADYRLTSSSPALDAGENGYVDGSRVNEGYPLVETDLSGNSRIGNGTVDIGAYEFHFGAGDLNGDGAVDSGDLDIIRANWGRCVPVGAVALGDPTNDGFVNGDDLEVVRANWGTRTPVAAGAETKAALLAAVDQPASSSATEAAHAAMAADRPGMGPSETDLATLAEAAWLRELEGRKSRGKVREVRQSPVRSQAPHETANPVRPSIVPGIASFRPKRLSPAQIRAGAMRSVPPPPDDTA